MAWSVWKRAEELCQEHGMGFEVSYNPEPGGWDARCWGVLPGGEDWDVLVFGPTPLKAAMAATNQAREVLRRAGAEAG